MVFFTVFEFERIQMSFVPETLSPLELHAFSTYPPNTFPYSDLMAVKVFLVPSHFA